MPAESPATTSPVLRWEDVRPRTGRDESVPRFVETRAGRFAYHEVGPSGGAGDAPDARAAPPLLLLHGFSGHRDDFIGVMPFLADGRRVIALDQRGHGDSVSGPGAAGYSFEQLVADLLAVLDALGIERIDLLGHSVGGMVALRFALAYPERVRSLVFVCTAPAFPERMSPRGFELATALCEAHGMAELQRRAAAVVRKDPFPGLAAWTDPERYDRHHARRHLAMTPESYRGVGEAFFRSTSLIDRLGEIDAPCLVLVGEHDHDWRPGAEAFAAGLRDVRVVVVPDAEHHPHQENPSVFFTELMAHLARLG